MDQWSQLIPDLLLGIEDRLPLYVDKLRFRSVCMSWKSKLPNLKSPKDLKFPCLLHPLTLDTSYFRESDPEDSQFEFEEGEWESEGEGEGDDGGGSGSEGGSESESKWKGEVGSESEGEGGSESEEGGSELEESGSELEESESEKNEAGESEAEEGKASHALFYPDGNTMYHLHIPCAKGVIFKGSSHGWVVTIQDTFTRNCPDIYLLNPLTNAQIQLPPRNKFPDVLDYRRGRIRRKDGVKAEYKVVNTGDICFMPSYTMNLHLLCKVVLSSSPLSEDCVAVAIYGEFDSLAYCKCNDTEWKFLFQDINFKDVLFHKGKLYAVDTYGNVRVFENIGPNPKVTQIPIALDYGALSCFFAESSAGELILALRHEYQNVPRNYRYIFRLYKLDPDNSTWVQTKDIGDDMLFLGSGSSLTVSSRDFPGHKGNRIYLADDFYTFQINMESEGVFIRVFNLDDRRCEPLPGYSYVRKGVWPPPLWITPSTL